MLRSFIPVPAGSDFPLQNIPLGAARAGASSFTATRLGDTIVNLKALSAYMEVPVEIRKALQRSDLTGLMALGQSAGGFVRKEVQRLLAEGSPFQSMAGSVRGLFWPADEVRMQLPARIGDYTDFYSSREHATNVGIMFRGRDNALQPNWLHLPVGYHGRASSIVPSGAPVRRPSGQTKADTAEKPSFGPSRTLDFELEVGAFVGSGNDLGHPVPVDQAADYVFGLVLLNDWSARDIQKWEYVPLGPFLAKNFATTISPWVVLPDALAPFKTEGPVQDPEPLPYLKSKGNPTYDIRLEVTLIPSGGEPTVISLSNFRHLYWNMAQQIAHHTVTGCNLQPGDLLGSGTISAPDPGGFGSLLELTWRGERPLALNGGHTRTFLQDGDTVTMRGWCEKDGLRIGFGECSGTIMPAL